jgi:hypothetical protein
MPCTRPDMIFVETRHALSKTIKNICPRNTRKKTEKRAKARAEKMDSKSLKGNGKLGCMAAIHENSRINTCVTALCCYTSLIIDFLR